MCPNASTHTKMKKGRDTQSSNCAFPLGKCGFTGLAVERPRPLVFPYTVVLLKVSCGGIDDAKCLLAMGSYALAVCEGDRHNLLC